MDPTALAHQLEVNGVDLNEPASDEQLKQFEEEMGITLDGFFRKVYLKFNGFFLADDRNHIELWPLVRILEKREDSVEKEQEQYFAIGDFMMDADFLMCCLTREAAPIFYLHEKTELAPTASKFFAKLISGDFDF